ncbi:MAG: peptide deformylase [Oscillospiraceae bacterium]|nr:peptide deformylase [Oscillospiraceae bacterium]
MALRNILTEEESSLYKKCRTVTDFNPRLHQLLDDMRETLVQADGVGLAAPQVGVLRRAALVLETNVPEGEEPYIIELINPVILEQEGEQHEAEGCLSVPGKYGIVRRPERVRLRAQDRNGESFEVEGTGLTARCFCHELDHLEGIVFTSQAERMLTEEELAEMNGED